MDPSSELPNGRAVRTRRAARRKRALLATGLAGVLVWSSLAFLQTTAVVSAEVQQIPGLSDDGTIADVVALSDLVTAPQGNAQRRIGVKIARLDVAEAFHNDMRVTLAWQNAPEFSRQTKNGSWQLRFGLYYPVRTGDCNSNVHANDAANQVATVELTTLESFGGGSETYCAYRDLSAAGPGIVTAGDDQGTQLLAVNRLGGILAPKTSQTGAITCASTGGTPCQPAGLASDKRAYFVVASLLNAGGSVPPGQQDTLDGLRMFIRVDRGGA